MRHTLYLSSTLIALWLLNSGHYTPLILALGCFSVGLTVWIAHKMDVVDGEAQPIHLTLRLPGYWFWLTKEIVLSNIDVVKRVWLAPDSIDPAVATLKISQTTDMGRVIYANSITLTPGTVTLDLKDDEVLIHSLTREGLRDLQNGEMDRRVSLLEK